MPENIPDPEREEEMIALVSDLYNKYLDTEPTNPKITTHDLALWGYRAWLINIREMRDIRAMPNVFLP